MAVATHRPALTPCVAEFQQCRNRFEIQAAEPISATPRSGRGDEARFFGENSMRVLFGIILGVALTVSVAFISDTWSAGPTTTGSSSATLEHRQMVNWDVVGDNMRIARERLHAAWNKLSGKIES
jgi:hypothetical protein